MTIEAYLAALTARLRVTRWRRRRILDEVRDHLLEAATRERARGLVAADAEARAVARFGDADLIAREFAEALRGPSRGRAIALLWFSVSAACAASLAMTWHHAEPAPARITLAESTPQASPFHRVRPPAIPVLARPRTFTQAPASVQRPATPAEPAPAPAPSPSPSPESFAHLVALALPPPPGTTIRVSPTPAPVRTKPAVPLHTRVDVAARYPREARMMAIEGDVLLRLHVAADGRVDDVEVTHSLGYGLDEVALAIARGLRFRPATDERGVPTASTVNWTVHCARQKEPAYAVPVFEGLSQSPSPVFAKLRI